MDSYQSTVELHTLLFVFMADLKCGSLPEERFGLIVEYRIRCHSHLHMPLYILHELSVHWRWTLVFLRNKVCLLCASTVGQRGLTEVETLTQTMSVAALGKKKTKLTKKCLLSRHHRNKLSMLVSLPVNCTSVFHEFREISKKSSSRSEFPSFCMHGDDVFLFVFRHHLSKITSLSLFPSFSFFISLPLCLSVCSQPNHSRSLQPCYRIWRMRGHGW